jgi:hypothetical protein
MVLRVPPRVRLPFVDQIKLDLLCDTADSCCILQVIGIDEKLNIHNTSFRWANSSHWDPITPITFEVDD